MLDRAAAEISGDGQGYDLNANINALRRQLDAWHQLPPQQWRVTPQTARLLQHWRHHPFSGICPFFCQVEAAETVIWLTEVAPRLGREAGNILKHLQNANDGANPGLSRLALDGVRFLAHGRHRVRHRQAASRTGGRQRSQASKCPSTATSGSTSARPCRRRAGAPTPAL